jgi:two-component system chemotaxis response regulator CheY
VEDEPTTRMVLEDILSERGECRVCANGLDAVRLFGEALRGGEPFDVVIMDLIMPQMDGTEALGEMRAMERDHGVAPGSEVAVVVLSETRDVKQVMGAYREGLVSAYLSKPLDGAVLLRTLDELTGSPQAESEG